MLLTESHVLQEAVKTDTEGALASMKELGDIVSADQEDMSGQVSHSLVLCVITEYIRHLGRKGLWDLSVWLLVVLQVSQMRSLYGKCRETLQKMQQKTRDCLRQREDMRRQMEEALQDKQAVKDFSID